MPESWNSALNFGGGAKWFMKPHLGASFDVRFVKLGSRSATDDAAGGQAHAAVDHQRRDFDSVASEPMGEVNGAGDGDRTRDIELGKLAFYR